jgi:hypothetical protein
VPPDATPGLSRVRLHGKTAASLLAYDDFEPADPSSVPELLELIAKGGKRCTVACDLVASPLDALGLGPVMSFVPVQPEQEGGLRDLPVRPPAPDAASSQLLSLMRVLTRERLDTRYVVTGDLSVPLRILAP